MWHGEAWRGAAGGSAPRMMTSQKVRRKREGGDGRVLPLHGACPPLALWAVAVAVCPVACSLVIWDRPCVPPFHSYSYLG